MARTKPNYEKVWADTGSKIDPDVQYGAGKTETGWGSEIPIAECENFTQNKQDQFNAHINDYGIPTWDDVTDYPDGAYSRSLADPTKVFRSVQAVPAGNVDPNADNGTYWAQIVNYTYGSNANGEYRIWEDGLIEMWITNDNTTAIGAGETLITLPTSFVTEIETVCPTVLRSGTVGGGVMSLYWRKATSTLSQVAIIMDESGSSPRCGYSIYLKGR